MPDHFAQNFQDTDAGSGKSTHSYQPAWVTPWIQQKSNLSSQVLHDESKVNDSNSKQAATLSVDKGQCDISEYSNAWRYKRDSVVASDVPPSVNEFGMVSEAKISTFTNEKLVMISRNFESARSDLQPFSMFNFNQKMATIFSPNKDQTARDSHTSGFQYDAKLGHGNTTVETSEHNLPSTMLSMAPYVTNTPRQEICSQTEPILQAREQSVITHLPLERKSLPISSPQEDVTGSTFTFVQHGFELGGTAAQSYMCRKKDIDESSSSGHHGNANTHVVHDCNYPSSSTSLLGDSNMNKSFISRDSRSLYSGQNEASQQVHDPSPRNLQSHISVVEQGRNTNVFPGTGFLPRHINPLEMSKPEEIEHGCHSQLRMPMVSPRDVGQVRMFTAVECLEGVPGDSLQSVQTFHHLLMTKKTGVDLYKEDGMIKESAGFNRSKGEIFTDLGKEDARDRKTGALGIKNESSGDTDIMDIEIYEKRKNCLGTSSFPSNKDLTVGQNPAMFQATLSSSRETNGRRKSETNLFDLNQEPPSFLASAKSMDDIDMSTSRTESFNGEHILPNATQLDNFNSNLEQDSLLGLDPSNRLVKRLKLTASDSVGHYTKTLRTEDEATVEKVGKLFDKNKDYTRTGEELPMSGEHLGKEHEELGKTMMSSISGGPSSKESVKERRNRTLSNSWIRRLCHSQAAAPLINSSASVDCNPQSSKETLDEFQTQLPSIAAMALMGKAMTGYQECAFTDNGSFVVWNSGEV